MHYSQGRDRWFGRIQSAPTANVNNSRTFPLRYQADLEPAPTVDQDQTTAGGNHRAASLRPLAEERKEI